MAESLNRNVLRKFGDSRFVIRKEASGDYYTGSIGGSSRKSTEANGLIFL